MRLAGRPEPFWLKMHSALPTPRLKEQKEVQPAITEVMRLIHGIRQRCCDLRRCQRRLALWISLDE